ncbi:hypothetical protein DQT32_04550 [Salmonella enterica subsp. enterica serovar Braenderup]|nr:hypothetical protein [Salmonella enterica subsp. enterica serovar Braenderup]
MTNYLLLTYNVVGIVAAVYILIMYLRGAFIYMKRLYTVECVYRSDINIQFGYTMNWGDANSWWGILFQTACLTFFHIVLALVAWPLFFIWVISYTIKVARKKKFGSARY